MYPTGGGLLVLVTVCTICQGLFSPGQELVYRYHAVVRAGTLQPTHGSSEWELKGRLVVQSQQNIALVQLIDLEVSLYNGIPGRSPSPSPEKIFLPIPAEASELSNLFTVHYEGSKVTAISVGTAESLWSVNIKRALASLLQLEESQLHTSAFSAQENNLFGQCLVEYSIVQEEGRMVVRKFLDHEACSGYPRRSWSNVAPLPSVCSSGLQPVTASGGRTYVLELSESEVWELKSIHAKSGINVQPFQAQGELRYAFVNQTLDLESKQAIETLKVQSDAVQVGLTYEHQVKDLTQGRDNVTAEYHLNLIDYYLDLLADELESSLFEVERSELHHQHISNLLYFLGLLDIESLGQYYSKVTIGTSYRQETQRNFFLKLLPQVGSDASILFIRNLVRDNVVNAETAGELLSVLPFYVHHPSEQLLKECEELLSLSDDVKQDVKHLAVLSFSTLVYKTCQLHCRPETLDIYVRQFLELFTSSSNYGEQLLYLEALSNIELGNVFDHIEPIIRGNVTVLSDQPHHIRFLGVWATMARAPYNHEKVYQIYWPILTNHTEHLEMRVAALTMLLLAKPTHGNFLNLLWFMLSEQNSHLQHFYYTTLESLVNTKYPCYIHLGKLASQVIRLVRPPAIRNWATGNYILDYSDPKYGFGGLSQLFAVANQRTGNPNVLYLVLNTHAQGLSRSQFGLYLKLQGVADAVVKMIRTINADSLNLPRLAEILHKLKAPTIPSESIHIEIIAKIEGRVVFCQYINHTTFYKLSETMTKVSSISQEFHINYQSLKAPVLMEVDQPTDLGTPLLLRLDTSSFISIRGKFTKDKTASLLTRRNQFDLRFSIKSEESLIIYNPVLNLWHATRRSITLQEHAITNIQLTVASAQWQVKLSNIRTKDTAVVWVIHKETVVDIQGIEASEQLKSYCPTCQILEVITGREKKSDLQQLVNGTYLGTKYQIYKFDCEHPQLPSNLMKLLRGVLSEDNNHRVLPVSRSLLGFLHLMDQLLLVPPPGSCGLKLRGRSEVDEDTQLEVVWQLAKENPKARSNTERAVGTKHVLQYLLILKSASTGTILKSWSFSAALEQSLENTKNNFRLRVKRSTRGELEYRFCVDAETRFPKWHHDPLQLNPSEDVTGKINIVWGKSDSLASGKCPDDGAKLNISLLAQVTEEQRSLLNKTDKWPYNVCLAEKQNVAQWGTDFTPLTEACYKASSNLATLRKYSGTMRYFNLDESAISFVNRVATLLEVVQPGITSEVSDLTATVSLTVPESQPLIELTVNKRHVTLEEENSWLESLLINTRFQAAHKVKRKLGLLSSCIISTIHVNSLDNATHNFQPSSCYTLVSADCSSQPKFALLVKKVAGPKPLAVKLYTGGHHVEVLPSPTGEITYSINQKKITPDKHGFQYPPGEKIYDFKVWHHEGGLAQVESPLTGVQLQYNGHAMVLVVPGWYRGQLCGLCGDFNDVPSNDSPQVLSLPCEDD